MNWCIAIGCYKLANFVELCIRRCRVIFGSDTPIFLVDDYSESSGSIAGLAREYGCAYLCGSRRKSHFSGDMQVFISGLVFCEETESDVLLKLSQRFIPVLPEFRLAAEHALNNGSAVCCPGKMDQRQIARPQAQFYARFGILTDVMAIKRGAIEPQELLEVYRQRVRKPQCKSDSFAETTWGYLLATSFDKVHAILLAWTNHVRGQPKIYLRKSQSTARDYEQIAAMEGLKSTWDLREWGLIEKHQYQATPTDV